MANPKAPHPTASTRSTRALGRAAAMRRARTVLGWAAPVWLCLVYLSVSETRPGLRGFLGLGYLLLLWFFLSRTKTLSWQSLGALVSIGLPWALMVGLITRPLAAGLGQVEVDDLGARTALAAVSETSLILLPLLVLVVLAPTRVRGFSVTDWLLAGLAAGVSFQVVEELARLDGAHLESGPGLLSGGGAVLPEAGFAGRPVLTALLGVTIGLAVAAWRHGGKPVLSPVGRIAWRALAVLAPPGCWWLVVSVQAGWNATLVTGNRWLTAPDPSMPAVLRLGWRLGQHGFGLGWLLVGLFVIALLVDAGRLRNAADEADDPLPYPFAPTAAADQWAGRLTGWAGTRTAVPVTAAVWLIATSTAVIAYAVRDLAVVLAGYGRAARAGVERRSGRGSGVRPHWLSRVPGGRQSVESTGRPPVDSGRRQPGEPGRRQAVDSGRAQAAEAGREPAGGLDPGAEPVRERARESRWTAIARGNAAGVMVRTIRAEALALAAGPDTPATRRLTRASGVAGLLAVLLAVSWLGPHWAAGIGDSVAPGESASGGGEGTPMAWLAGTLTAAGSWWDALAIWQYAVLGVGFVALMVFSASPLDLPALGGRSVWFAVRSPSGARPLDRARSYLSLSSPAELVVDGLGSALGLLPGGAFTGPALGHQIGTTVEQFVAAPQTFIQDRRAAARAAAERPAAPATASVRLRGAAELPPVKLADGRLLSALTADDERLFAVSLEDLARDLSRNDPSETGRDGRAEAEYRARIYGDDERLISLRPEKWSDGQNPAYGMVADTVYYDGRGASWYLPDTLPESIRHKAYLEMDRRLIEYATVVYYPASPFRALEITTNHPLVAQALEERMSRLAIPGYVVLEP